MKLTYVFEVPDAIAEKINQSGEPHGLNVYDYFLMKIEIAVAGEATVM